MVGHVHLKIADLEHTLEFYQDVLGLTLTERHSRFAFLSFGDRHHDVALQEVGADAPGPSNGIGLYHFAFEVAEPASLVDCYQKLKDRDVAVSPVDHGISKALYFDDPDGNGLEVYLDTRAQNDQEMWDGTNRRFDPMELV